MEAFPMIRRSALRLASAAVVLAVTACASMPQPASVTDVIARNPQLTTLSQLIAAAGLDATLRGNGAFTVFAPSDEAFKAVPAATLAKLGSDKEALLAVLTYHVLPSKVMAADVPNGNAKSVQGANLALAKAGTFVTVEDAVVQTPDLAATNGVVHIVDRVLTPPKK
jgi:uncharacterized surface protein with fasciclin (FAS1) repeats